MYVLDETDRIVGVAKDDLLARALRDGRPAVTTVELVQDFLTVPADRALIDLVQLVGRHSVPLAVVDDGARLLGVVPRAAVLDALAAVPAQRRT